MSQIINIEDSSSSLSSVELDNIIGNFLNSETHLDLLNGTLNLSLLGNQTVDVAVQKSSLINSQENIIISNYNDLINIL
jgi:hypothetical protein